MIKVYEQATVALGRMLTLSLNDLKREEGQGATEYGILIALVVVTIGVTIATLGTAITNFLGRVAKAVDTLVTS